MSFLNCNTNKYKNFWQSYLLFIVICDTVVKFLCVLDTRKFISAPKVLKVKRQRIEKNERVFFNIDIIVQNLTYAKRKQHPKFHQQNS